MRVCVFVCVCVCVRACVCVCVERLCVRACRTAVRALVARRGPSVFIARRADGPRVRAALVLAIGRFACVHAGVTWTSRTSPYAPWAARWGHTTLVDAAGAIYVIGGYGSTCLMDVWASTDGGAHRSQSRALDGAPATCLLVHPRHP